MTTRFSKLTPFGQLTRKLRVDYNEYLKDMAARLSVTSTYLSAVEHGKRNPPYDWVDRLQEAYGLSEKDKTVLEKALSASRTFEKLDISDLSFDEKQFMRDFVKRLPELDTRSREMLDALVYGENVSRLADH